MVSTAGLSAVYGGYQAGRQMDQQIQQNDQKLLAGDIEQQGNEALGRTIQAFQAQFPGSQPMPGGGAPTPQPPMPGQPSMPSQPQNPAMIGPPPPMQQAGPAPTQAPTQAPPMQPPGQPAVPQGGGSPLEALKGRLDVQTLMGAIAKANPGAKPAVLAAAVTKALPLLTAQAQMDWKTQMATLGAGRLENARVGTEIRQGESVRREAQGNRRLDQQDQRIATQEDEADSRILRRSEQSAQGGQRLEQQAAREARLAASGAIRQDQRWQQLEQQRTALEERIRSGQSKEGLSQWRATLDAQHKRAMEIIQANSINSNMRPEEKKALLDEQNKAYEDAIKNMKPGAQVAPKGDGSKDQGRAPKGAAIGAPPAEAPAAARPRARNPQTGEEVEFDGQGWVPAPGRQSMATGDIEVSSMNRRRDPSNPLPEGRAPPGGGGGGLSEPVQRAGTPGAGTGPSNTPPGYFELERAMGEYARGNITASQVQKVARDQGWTVNLRGKRGEAEAFDPRGKQHYISF